MKKGIVGKVYSVYVQNQKKKRSAKIRFQFELVGLFILGAFAGASFYTII